MHTLHLGDCLDVLKTIATDSIDSIVTDPPYGISFMGKKWDYDVPSIDVWKECLRVLKPGGHMLAFGGARTYHRLAIAIEDAGFEIRDQLQWLTGQGFPKNLNVLKAAQKEGIACECNSKSKDEMDDSPSRRCPKCSKPILPEGIGTALKPSNEPICLARKPLSEPTVAKNVVKHGTGGLNIDACRIGTAADMNPNDFDDSKRTSNKFKSIYRAQALLRRTGEVPNGRWPANLILDEIAAEMLDQQSLANGIHSAGKGRPKKESFNRESSMFSMGYAAGSSPRFEDGDNVGASRFFYVAKVSPSERGDSKHPTMKPIKLMTYLCTLITPPSGTVLDPFMGSGSTGIAALKLGFHFVGIEREKAYLDIATKRIESLTHSTTCAQEDTIGATQSQDSHERTDDHALNTEPPSIRDLDHYFNTPQATNQT